MKYSRINDDFADETSFCEEPMYAIDPWQSSQIFALDYH